MSKKMWIILIAVTLLIVLAITFAFATSSEVDGVPTAPGPIGPSVDSPKPSEV